MDSPLPKAKGGVIKNIYLYLVSFVALMMVVFSLADIINIALKTFIFTKADDYYSYYEPVCTPAVPADATSTNGTPRAVKGDIGCLSKEEQDKRNEEQRIRQRQNSLVRDISMVVVAVPVFAYHWMIIRKKENE